jgi:hypothetical protein
VAAIAAAVVFALLVFSYVYLWTAAAGWTVCLALLWALFRPAGWRSSWRSFAVIGFGALLAVGCFVVTFAKRSATMDSVQALELSRAPDLFRVPELIGLLVLLSLGILVGRGGIKIGNQKVLLAASFALLPVVVFNQQIITGHSLQPLHYEMFVANYSVLIAVIIGLAVILKHYKTVRLKIPRRALLWIALTAFEWGAYETLVAARGSMPLCNEVDEARPVAMRVQELGKAAPGSEEYLTILATDLLVADSFPTTARQSVLWAPHMLVFAGASHAESKERFYQYLYYTGVGPEELRSILRNEGRYGFAVGLFGFERTIRGLSRNSKTITAEELEHELELYSAYYASFSQTTASRVKLSYAITAAEDHINFANLDRWYERDRGERVGKFVLFRTKLRQSPPNDISHQ